MGRITAAMDTNQQMKPTEYFDRHPVFRFDDFAEAHAAGGRRSRQTTASVLKTRDAMMTAAPAYSVVLSSTRAMAPHW